MGNQLASASLSQPPWSEYYLHELPGTVQESYLGKGRFLKTLQCIHPEGKIVLKVFLKRDPTLSLKEQTEKLAEIKENFALIERPNVLAFQKWENTDKAGYLLRQYFANNLYDRISTRPFLTMIEKKWLVFQLLNALSQCHFYGICHGDIKSENVMVTDWNWAYLVDFACYKPTFIPEDNPADFSFFFDTSGRRTCYIAPERFVAAGGAIVDGDLTPQMDVFSVGCVIAELFLDGTPVFNFSQLLAYRKGEYDPDTVINRIPDAAVQELVRHMVQRDPSKRFGAAKYLSLWTNSVFPPYFEFLHKYVAHLMALEPDEKVLKVRADFDKLLSTFEGSLSETPPQVPTPLRSSNSAGFSMGFHRLRSSQPDVGSPGTLSRPVEGDLDKLSDGFDGLAIDRPATPDFDELGVETGSQSSASGLAPAAADKAKAAKPKSAASETEDSAFVLLMETENLIHRLETENEEHAARLQELAAPFVDSPAPPTESLRTSRPRPVGPAPSYPVINTDTFLVPSPLFAPGQPEPLLSSHAGLSMLTPSPATSALSTAAWAAGPAIPLAAGAVAQPIEHAADGLVTILSVICAFLGMVRFVSTKLKALELFSLFTIHLDSEIRLQRIVPYVVSMLNEENALARATAIRTLTVALEKVETFPPSDSQVFPAYILPSVTRFSSSEKEELVREAFAESVAQLAETARRFLDHSQLFKQNLDAILADHDKDMVSYQESYDAELVEIQDAFYDVVVEMLTKDPSTAVRRTLLSDITRLCIFFGRQKTNDFLLPLIITFLNDRHDWELRCAFFHNIVGVSAFVGMDSLESFILPCILQSLSDEEPFVIEKAVNSLSSLCERNLFRKHVLFEIAEKTAPLLFHPFLWIRYGVMAVFAAVAKQLCVADVHCFLLPLLRPYLLAYLVHVTEDNLLEALKPPVSKENLDAALSIYHDLLTTRGSSEDFKKFTQSNSFVAMPSTSGDSQPSTPKLGPSALHLPSAPPGSLPIAINSGGGPSLPVASSLANSPLLSATPFSSSAFGPAASSSEYPAQSGGGVRRVASAPTVTSILEGLDPVDQTFMLRVRELKLPAEEEAKIFTMKSFIRAASRCMKRPADSRTDEPPVSHLTRPLTVPESVVLHSVPVVAVEKKSVTSRISRAPRLGSTPVTRTMSSLTLDAKRSKSADLYSSISLRSSKTDVVSSMDIALSPISMAKGTSFLGSQHQMVIADYVPVPASQKPGKAFPNVPVHLIPPPLPDLGTLLSDHPPPSKDSLQNWQPKGILVAHLHEHKAPVNNIQISRDFMFFASSSDDGTVKIWDCQRLEKNVTNRSRLTYSSQPGKIKALTICENSHSVAAGSDAGSIHVFRIEYATKKETSLLRYTGATTVKNIESTEGAVVALDHFDTSQQSLLVYATNRGKVHGWDLRCKSEAWVLENAANLGLLGTFVVGPGRNWLVTGTSLGYYTLWDIRFGVAVRTWRHPYKQRIHRLAPCGSPRNPTWIYSASGQNNEITVWDVQDAKCKQFLRVLPEDGPQQPLQQSSYLAPLTPLPPPSPMDYCIEELRNPMTHGGYGVKALLNPSGTGYLLSAGDDRRIRFWDLDRPERSYTVCGVGNEAVRTKLSTSTVDGVTVFQEGATMSSMASQPAGAGTAGVRGPASPAVVHHESILDVQIMEQPHRMLVSASRDGVIKVWK